jgi:hypothetical protein
MFVQTRNPILSRALLDALLAALSTRPAAALLVTPFVHLFTAGPSPITLDTVSADFTEAAFTGSAPGALALPLLGPINIDASDLGAHNEVDFLCTAVTPPGETILGYWIDNSATTPTEIYLSETFQTPVSIATPGDYISLDVIFPTRINPSINP